jgi:tRNA threonylcarbamoyladenosine biosynthesis protein TsaE
MSFDLPLQLLTKSVEETEALGEKLAAALLSDLSLPRYIALRGDLGVGKTAFVRGFTKAIAPEALVRSPTFALVNEYRPPRVSGRPPVFHFDMYRITSEDDLYSIGYDDYLDRGICLVEWSENIPYALPESYFKIEIVKTSPERPDERRISACMI